MSGLDGLKAALPDYARDTKLNLSSVLTNSPLTPQQVWGAALGVAIAAGNPEVIAAIDTDAREMLSPEAHQAARAAASIMAMNNVYYRATHLIGEDAYQALPARLRMTVIGNPGVDKLDFELWCVAISAVAGCGACLAAHENTLTKAGLARETVHEALRLAAVISAVSVTLRAESVLNAQLA